MDGQVRTMRYALEAILGKGAVTAPRGGDASSLVSWLVEYAVVLLNRLEVGHDGRTAHERLRHKPSRTLGVEFWVPRNHKLDTVWEQGVYVGHRTISGESMIATAKGMYKTRTSRRLPADERWVGDSLKFFQFFPWKSLLGRMRPSRW